jgi:hypothetical protein
MQASITLYNTEKPEQMAQSVLFAVKYNISSHKKSIYILALKGNHVQKFRKLHSNCGEDI